MVVKVEAKSAVATNIGDRPVRRRGSRHNSELENKIVRAAGAAATGSARRGRPAPDMAGRVGLDAGSPAPAGRGRHGKTGNGAEDIIKSPPSPQKKSVEITAPNFQTVIVPINGTAPYVQHAFSQKALLKMEATHRAGSTARTRKVREARDFEEDYENAKHKSAEGWLGIPAPAIRNALISACKIVGFFQTRAKLALFVEADGLDAVDGTPLIKIIGDPEIHKGWGRNESGTVDLRWRPMWKEWSAQVRIKYDADMFSTSDIANLMMRAGQQVGIGEGRPDSPNSNGMGWGVFEVLP